jgi:hypothetical protein
MALTPCNSSLFLLYQCMESRLGRNVAEPGQGREAAAVGEFFRVVSGFPPFTIPLYTLVHIPHFFMKKMGCLTLYKPVLSGRLYTQLMILTHVRSRFRLKHY